MSWVKPVDASRAWTCGKCPHKHHPQAPCPRTGYWLVRGQPHAQPDIIWLKKPMPPDQWPPDQRATRDNTFQWWVRTHCGHQGGAKQFAFYEEHDADVYEHVFRDDPCRWTGCLDGRRAKRLR